VTSDALFALAAKQCTCNCCLNIC